VSQESSARPSTRAGSKAWTRAQVLTSARQVFAERGYEGASMTEIARAAGVAVGSVYGHFATKQDLYWAVVSARLEAERQAAEAAIGNIALDDFLRAYGQMLVRSADEGSEIALQSEVWLHALRDESFREQMRNKQRQVQEMVGRLVSRLRDGTGPWELTDDEVATVATALFRGLVQARSLDAEAVPESLYARCMGALLSLPAQWDTL
jgi:AcrR family transcriptional regulator